MSAEPLHDSEEYNQIDEMIDRDRGGRLVGVIVMLFLAFTVTYFVLVNLLLWFNIPLIFARALGIFCGAELTKRIYKRSTIGNDVAAAFVTINPLVTMFGNGDPQISYGPGKHWCYPFEHRSAKNSVPLTEEPEIFHGEVQCLGGTLDFEGTSLIRPDIRRLPQFLSGAGGVSSNLIGLIAAEIVSHLAEKDLNVALKDLNGLNERLLKKFQGDGLQGEDVTHFEERFGVIVGSFTVQKLLPSKEVQETANAITELRNVIQMTYESFGCQSMEEVYRKVEAGTFTNDQVQRRFRENMIISGNNKGIDIKENVHIIDIKGLDSIDPKLADVLGKLGVAAATQAGTKKESSGGNSKKSGNVKNSKTQ